MRKIFALLVLLALLFGAVIAQGSGYPNGVCPSGPTSRPGNNNGNGHGNGNGNGHGNGNGNGHGNGNGNGNPTHTPGTPAPTGQPTTDPTSAPTTAPTTAPTHRPTHQPTEAPTDAPTTAPTVAPTRRPTDAPTQRPTHQPTDAPTQRPTHQPTDAPTTAPTRKPTSAPTHQPTTAPTRKPTSSGSSSGSASGSSSGSSTDLCTATPTSQEPLTILVPLYVDPGSEWDQLITAAETGVKIVAIINPNSGPVSSGPDSNYKSYMTKFANAGIDMVGYIHTSYAARAISEIQSEVDTYASKYTGLKGIFLDEVSAEANDVAYYTQAYNYILSKPGYIHDIINPGTQPTQGYLDAATTIVVFESPASSFKDNFASWVGCAPSAAEKANYKYKFGAIAYGASSGSVSSLMSEMANAGMGMVYATDGAGGCCTYNDLTSYFAAEAAAVKALNA
jgi:hypothetical protein